MTFAEKKQVHTFYNEKKTKQQKYIAMTVDWQTNTQTHTRTNTQTHTQTRMPTITVIFTPMCSSGLFNQ